MNALKKGAKYIYPETPTLPHKYTHIYLYTLIMQTIDKSCSVLTCIDIY